MTLRQRVFPVTPPADRVIVRTKYVGSWESQLRGLGRHTAYLSRDLVEFRADVDDIAMDLVFLQRHRVEVALKLLLERTGAALLTTHDIEALSGRCQQALTDAGHGALARTLDAETREFVELVHAADPGSYAYRYPVDRQNQPAARESFVDLQELEVAGAAFQDSVLRVVAALTLNEPVPVDDDDVNQTAIEAAATIRSLRTAVAFLEETYKALERDRRQAASARGLPDLGPGASGVRAREMADEQLVALRTLNPPLENLLQRLSPRITCSADVLARDADAIPQPPEMQPARMLAPDQHARRRMEEVAEGIVEYFPPLKSALGKMVSRTASWTSESDRQLHADLERFYTRIMPGVDPDAPAAGGDGAN